ncbi:hypothetical protein MMC07_002046 [Pseudocyphellaria aurata]|nr:hypothetical protein [Pseudocyphellaria aurata]
MSDDSSSDMSVSPLSSTSSVPSPQSAFANPMSIPLKSTLSPPSTTSSTFSLSPATPIFPVCSPSATCAYPSWPNRDFLSSTASNASPYGGGNWSASSYVSDDDLLDLAELELYGDSRVPAGMVAGLNQLTAVISWEATKQPPVRLPSPPLQKVQPKRRRRGSPLKRKRPVAGLSPITEAPE